MDFQELHKPWADKESPSVEGQVRWLQKLGFPQHQIEQAMIKCYIEIENGAIPKRWDRTIQSQKGVSKDEVCYTTSEVNPGPKWTGRDIKGGFELDQFLLEMAKSARTEELSAQVRNMERLVDKIKDDYRKAVLRKRPWYKRMFGVKSAFEQEAIASAAKEE